MTFTDSPTITGTLAALPMQRVSQGRHRDPISSHEAAAEQQENWALPCRGRRCSKACVEYRGPGWRAFAVRS